MGERSEGHIVRRNDSHLVPVGGWGIVLAVIFKCLWGLAEETVHDGVKAFLPVRGKGFVRILGDGLHISLRGGVEFSVNRERLESRHRVLRHKAVVLNDM